MPKIEIEMTQAQIDALLMKYNTIEIAANKTIRIAATKAQDELNMCLWGRKTPEEQAAFLDNDPKKYAYVTDFVYKKKENKRLRDLVAT